MYYRGKYTYRSPRFTDLNWCVGARELDNGWVVGVIASGIVVQSDRGRQYLIEYADDYRGDRNSILEDFYLQHPGPHSFDVLEPLIHGRFQVRITQKSNRKDVYRGVVNRRLTGTAQRKIIAAVHGYAQAGHSEG